MPVTFEPWVPPGVDPRFCGLRLLIVGESHYDQGLSYALDQQRTFTQDIVTRWGVEGEGYQRLFANIFASFNEEGEHDARALWQSVLFYNYVQSFVAGGARTRPSEKQFADSADAFHAVLDEVRPEAAVVMSKATWNKMSAADAQLIEDDGAGLGPIRRYRYRGGSAPVAHTNHPSSPGYSSARWRQPLKHFLRRAGALQREARA